MTGETTGSEFAPASRGDWLKRVEAVLKGDDFEKRLVSSTGDGIRIDPVYQQMDGPRAARAASGPWALMQRCDHPDAAKANAQALEDLENGASGLSLIFQSSASAHGFGLAGHDEATIGRALRDVRHDLISLRLEPGPHGKRAAQAFAKWIAEEPIDPERLDLCFGMDPIGTLASRGDLAAQWHEAAARMSTTVADLRQQHFRGPFAVSDGRVWHDGGASETQEVALVLATAVAYLRALESLDEETLARAVSITLAADQDIFLTIAKFRAMRLVWGQVLSECRLPAASLKFHAETSWRMMTRRDPHSNIFRATAAVFGAALGGADSIAVLPFSFAQGLPDAFARRIARNTQILLAEESNLWRVADPAAGSGYVEHLTREIGGKAWELFRSVEKTGGMVSALQAGIIQKSIAEAKAGRMQRGETIVGTTDFRNAGEPSPSIDPVAPFNTRRMSDAAVTVDPIPAWRVAEAFEGADAAA